LPAGIVTLETVGAGIDAFSLSFAYRKHAAKTKRVVVKSLFISFVLFENPKSIMLTEIFERELSHDY